MNFLSKTLMLLVAQPAREWMISLDENAPTVVVSCTVLFLLALLALAFLMLKRRDLAAIQQADEAFLAALQNAPHVLSVYQEQQVFGGSSRHQIYLAACRELCFYLLGTDQVEKNFAMRLRAAGRISPSQMTAVTRAMRLASGECLLSLQPLAPGAFLCGLPFPFLGLFGSIAVMASVVLQSPSHDPDFLHSLVPVAAPFILSVLGLLVLFPQGRSLTRQLRMLEGRLQLFPLSLANLLERVFVDHRQSMEELPSVAALGAPHMPSLSLPPTGQAGKTTP